MTRPFQGVVEALCMQRLGRPPDLENPRGYNDIIQWLKLHDQRREQITACDKWAARDWVAERVGEPFLIDAKLGLAPGFRPFMAKCTHDSGSARIVHSAVDVPAAKQKLEARLAKPYGIEKGEWAYQFVEPRIIAERLLPGPVVDYKFHCAHGEPRWVQVIADRHTGKPKETILAPDGSLLAMHMDHKMDHNPDPAAYPGAWAWRTLFALAKTLSADWRYARVDLYWSMNRAWFGELTFWPLSGCYLTPYEPVFGEMLAIDLSEKLEPIVE